MKYTAEMIDFLREKARETWDKGEITRLFNERFGTNKGKDAIRMKLLQLGGRLGIKSDIKYTPEMLAFLRKEDGNCRSREELARLFNEKFGTQKTPANICDTLWRHGIQTHRRFYYTKEMDDFIRQLHNKFTYSELTKLFNEKFKTNSTGDAISQRCRKLGLRCSEEIICKAKQRYSQNALDFVREKLPHVKTRYELARLLHGRFPTKRHDIKYIIKRYFSDNIRKIHYTKEMEEFLRKNVSPDISYFALTRMFNETFNIRGTISAISSKCYSMGLACGRGSEAEMVIYCDRNKKNDSPDNIEILTKGEFQALAALGMYSEEPEVTKAGIALVRLTRRLKELQKRKRTN